MVLYLLTYFLKKFFLIFLKVENQNGFSLSFDLLWFKWINHSPSTKEIKHQNSSALLAWPHPPFLLHLTTSSLPVPVRPSSARLLGRSRLTSHFLTHSPSLPIHIPSNSDSPYLELHSQPIFLPIEKVYSINFYRTFRLYQTIKMSFMLHKTTRS